MNRIAVIFDFDDTLAPDSTSSFLEHMGVNVPEFWKKKVQPLLDDDWDPIPAYLYMMIEESNSGKIPPITRAELESFGSKISFHKGVAGMFKRLEDHVRQIYSDTDIEFYLISSGIGDILRNTAISKNFKDIWASDFSYDQNDKIKFPKKIVSFTDKTRYLFHIAKGLTGPKFRGKPFDVNKKVDISKLKVPTDHMIFVGDGYTDIPCFSLIKKGGGYAFGVYDNENRDKWGRAWGFIEEGRVTSLYSANFSEKSDLSNSLLMAIDSIANRIKLKSLTY
ncbi:MAG: HAD family hydrolase [Cytophagaceae bacterium]